MQSKSRSGSRRVNWRCRDGCRGGFASRGSSHIEFFCIAYAVIRKGSVDGGE